MAAWLYSRLLRVPLVASYHTHVPAYLPRLGLGWLVRTRRPAALHVPCLPRALRLQGSAPPAGQRSACRALRQLA